MWCKRAAAICSAAALFASAGCGPAKDAKTGVRPPQLAKHLYAADLLPADLDVVIRVDMARLKAGLGPNVAEALAARAAEAGGEGFVSEAMARADTVWIGLRLADVDAGDRVLIAEGRLGEVRIEPADWQETTPTATMERVQILDRIEPAPRAGTGRIVVYDKKLYAFVSPAEIDATTRLLRTGPDEGRGDPTADGLVSADVRGHRLPPSLEKKYPSIALIIAGIVRIRGSATLGDDGVRVAIDVTAKSPEAAKRVERFLSTLRETGESTRFAPLMKTVKIDQVDAHLHLTATVPAPMILGALGGADAGGATPGAPSASPGPSPAPAAPAPAPRPFQPSPP